MFHTSIFNEPRAIMPLNLTLSYRAITETDSYYYHVLIKFLTNAFNEFNQHVTILIWHSVMLIYTCKTILILIITPVINMLKKRALTSSQQNRPFVILSIPLNNFQSIEHTYWYSISQEICTRFLLCCALLWLYIDWFSHIHQAYFTGTVAI